MKKFVTYPAAALTAVALALPGPALAQAPGAIFTVIMPAGDFGSKNFTDLVVNSLTAATRFCGSLDESYRVDCLAERIGNMANDIPADSDYAEIRQVLDQTSKEMNQLARANRDASKPRQRYSSGGSTPQTNTRPLTAVGDVASVNAQALAILERTETLLLRTPEDGNNKKIHYTRIANALGSNKTLLRSA